jgi:hypothetical protein
MPVDMVVVVDENIIIIIMILKRTNIYIYITHNTSLVVFLFIY